MAHEKKTAQGLKSAAASVESEYTAAELIQAAASFGTVAEVAAVALKEKGISKATKSQAQTLMNQFLNRTVK